MGRRHRQPVRRLKALPASARNEVGFWGLIVVGLLTAAALYEAIGYRAEHVDHDYVTRYVPVEAVTSIGTSKLPSATPTPTLRARS
ncbi:hypothetical protein C8K36_10950 [Rhodococcus sp. OK519]|nr:hypothetical protein C8K36_10950 [Rhodococcus sp. OK519]